MSKVQDLSKREWNELMIAFDLKDKSDLIFIN